MNSKTIQSKNQCFMLILVVCCTAQIINASIFNRHKRPTVNVLSSTIGKNCSEVENWKANVLNITFPNCTVEPCELRLNKVNKVMATIVAKEALDEVYLSGYTYVGILKVKMNILDPSPCGKTVDCPILPGETREFPISIKAPAYIPNKVYHPVIYAHTDKTRKNEILCASIEITPVK